MLPSVAQALSLAPLLAMSGIALTANAREVEVHETKGTLDTAEHSLTGPVAQVIGVEGQGASDVKENSPLEEARRTLQCIENLELADYRDCWTICQHFDEEGTTSTIGSFEMLWWESNTCVVGFANLGCNTVSVNWQDILYPVCLHMLACVDVGNDALYFPDPATWGMTMAGTRAAPPYDGEQDF